MSRRKSGKKVSKVNTIETKVATILESMNVPFEQQVAIDKYTVDFLVDKKYIVECYGDFWHCNPIKFPEAFYETQKNNLIKDSIKTQWAADNGYKLLRFWENDINNNIKQVKQILLENTKS